MSVILGGLGILSEWCQFYLKSFLGCISEREVRQQMLKFGVLNMEGGVPWWVCGCGRSTLQIFKGPLRISMPMCEVHLIINWGICTILSSTPLYFYFSGWRCWQPTRLQLGPFSTAHLLVVSPQGIRFTLSLEFSSQCRSRIQWHL